MATVQGRPRKGRPSQNPSGMPAAAATATAQAPLVQAPWLPFALTTVLMLMSFLPRVQQNAILTRSFWGAAAALLLYQAVLFLAWRRIHEAGVRPALQLVAPRAQHYVQAMC